MAVIYDVYRPRLTQMGLNENFISAQTKAILRVYRDLKWALHQHEADLTDRLAAEGMGDQDTGLTFLAAFAPDIDLREFESRVCSLFENRSYLLVIDNAIERLRHYPERGEQYHTIIQLQYIAETPMSETELLDLLNLERSVFYRRKKEAIFVLGLCIFGVISNAVIETGYEQLSLFAFC